MRAIGCQLLPSKTTKHTIFEQPFNNLNLQKLNSDKNISKTSIKREHVPITISFPLNLCNRITIRACYVLFLNVDILL